MKGGGRKGRRRRPEGAVCYQSDWMGWRAWAVGVGEWRTDGISRTRTRTRDDEGKDECTARQREP